MPIPTAVSPSVLTPGVYLTVDLLASAAAAGVGTLKVLLLGTKSSTGDLTVDSEIREGGGIASAKTAFGPGTIAARAAEIIYTANPTALIDFGAPTAGTGVATKNITATGSPSANTAVEITVGPDVVTVAWLASETADTWKTRAIAAFNDDHLVVATSGGTGILTLSYRVAGNEGEDILVRAVLTDSQTGTEAVDTGTLTALVGGSTDPNYTTILAAAAGEEYHYIVGCLSSQDAESTTGNASRIETHILAYNSGLEAKLQQGIVASTRTLAAAKTAAVALNQGFLEYAFCLNGKGVPGELAGAEAAGRLAAVSIDPAANRIGEQLDYIGADDNKADKPTLAESEDALGNGVSIVSYDGSGNAVIVRPVTTYSKDSSNGDDRRLLDVQNVDAAYIVARDIRSFLPQEFPQAKITRDTLPGEEPPPAGVIEERDVRTAVANRLRTWATKGVVQRAALETAIEDGSLIVQVNESDSTQVDLVLPYKIVQPVAKWGVVAQRLTG